MSNQHKEYPELTQQTQAAYQAGCLAGQFSATPPANADRRYLAAFLRELIKHAHDCGTFREAWAMLESIADNLHEPPPPPPTLDQMEQALQNLLRRTDDPAGCHEGSVVAESADTIRRGIAHHCKVDQ